MSSLLKKRFGRVSAMLMAATVVLLAFGTRAAGQDQPAPKWEIFGGYSLFYPNSDVHGTLPPGLVPLTSALETNPRGAGASITYNFNRWVGLTLDGSTHWGESEATLGKKIDDTDFSNLSIGPKITFRHEHLSPFLEALVGDQRLAPAVFGDVDKLGFMVGGGLDLKVAEHISLRLIRADYVMSSYRFGPSSTTPSTDIRGLRAQAGIVLTFGGEEPRTPPSAVCSVHPSEVFAGEPVTLTAEGSNFNPKRTVIYSWTGTGISPATGASTQISTAGLQPGPYQVTANLADGSKRGVASCSTSFTVRTPSPPVIACSADPSSVKMGGTATITSSASSPDGRRLSYSYSASAGSISGDGPSATLDSGSAQPGTITVTCNVADDRNPPLTASSSATLAVQSPPPPPDNTAMVEAIEKRLALHSVYFATAKPSVEKPDAGLLPSQQKTLSSLADDFKTLLQNKPDASLTLEGHADPRGSEEYNQALSERRVDRARRYLIEQGVPEASIQTKAFGKQKNMTAAQVKDAVDNNPELSPADRQRVLSNMRLILLASNRRVDITLNNAGTQSQESVRQYPFNAADSLTLIQEQEPNKASKPMAHRKPRRKPQP
jgi:outer membrane protein OmpA-like peptidoglycan-associated protein